MFKRTSKEKKLYKPFGKWVINGLLVMGVFVCLIIVVFILAGSFQFGASDIRSEFARLIKQKTGYTLSASSFTYELFPKPRLVLKDVWLDRNSETAQKFFTAEQIDLNLSLVPLLVGYIRFSDVEIAKPSIFLEQKPDGALSWSGQQDDAAIVQPYNEGKVQQINYSSLFHWKGWTVDVSQIRLKDAHMQWRNMKYWHSGSVDFSEMTIGGILSPQISIKAKGSGYAAGFEVNGTADSWHKMGGLGSTVQGKWNFMLKGHEIINGKSVGEITLAGVSLQPFSWEGMHGTVDLEMKDLADINQVFRHSYLPTLQDVTLHTKIVAAPGARENSLFSLPLQLDSFFLKSKAFAINTSLVHGKLENIEINNDSVDSPVNFKMQVAGLPAAYPPVIEGRFSSSNLLQQAMISKLATPLPIEMNVQTSTASTLHIAGQVGGQRTSLAFNGKLAGLKAYLPMLLEIPALEDSADIKGKVEFSQGQRFSLEDFSLYSGKNSITGQMLVNYAQAGGSSSVVTVGPVVTGNINIAYLEADSFINSIKNLTAGASASKDQKGIVKNSPAIKTDAPPEQRQEQAGNENGDRKLPEKDQEEYTADDSAIARLGRWAESGTGSIDILINHLNIEDGLAYKNLKVITKWKNNLFTFQPDNYGSGEKGAASSLKMKGVFTINTAVSPLGYYIQSSGTTVPAQWLLKQWGYPPIVSGIMGITSHIRSAIGSDGSRNIPEGDFGLTLYNGSIDKTVLERLVAYVKNGNETLDLKKADGHSYTYQPLYCFDIKGQLSGDIIQIHSLAFDTEQFGTRGNGGIDYMAKTLDLHLQPQFYIGQAQAGSFVHLQGGWEHPEFSLERNQENGRFSLTLGFGNTQARICPEGGESKKGTHTTSSPSISGGLKQPLKDAKGFLRELGIVH